MPAFLLSLLSTLIASFLARLLLGAGLTLFTYSFVVNMTEQAKDKIATLMNGLPADILGIIGILQVDASISVIMSALSVSAFVKAAKVIVGKAQ